LTNGEIIQDFRRRWEGTFAWLYMDKLDEEILVYINRVEDSSDKVATIGVTNKKYGQLVLHLGSEEYELRFKYPPVGVFQHGDDVLLFRRRPARQYRRGICADNSVIWNVTRNVVGNRARFDASEVQSAFDHVTYGEAQALKLLESGSARGVAMRNNYSLLLSMDEGSDYVLWHWDVPVARVNAKGSITAVLEKSYAAALAEGAYK
jgi:hypothetical protein